MVSGVRILSQTQYLDYQNPDIGAYVIASMIRLFVWISKHASITGLFVRISKHALINGLYALISILLCFGYQTLIRISKYALITRIVCFNIQTFSLDIKASGYWGIQISKHEISCFKIRISGSRGTTVFCLIVNCDVIIQPLLPGSLRIFRGFTGLPK